MQDEPVTLSPQQEALIQELLTAHKKTFDMTCAQFIQFRVTDLFVCCNISLLSQPLSFTVCPQPLDRDQRSMSESSPDTNGIRIGHRPITEDPVQWVFNLTSHSSNSSSFQSLDSKEKKHFKSGTFTSLPHFTDLTTYMIKNVINFGKMLTMFR